MNRATHWENIYKTKDAREVSWFTPHLSKSLALIKKLENSTKDPVIDIGGGVSTLVDDLLAAGFADVSVLDVSNKSLELSRKRLGSASKKVCWIASDVTAAKLPKNHFALWHDRAVFHFLTGADERQKYKQVLRNSLKLHGFVILATFSLQGPPKCSGLDVARYSPETLWDEIGTDFKLIDSSSEVHKTPFGTLQDFTYGLFEKIR